MFATDYLKPPRRGFSAERFANFELRRFGTAAAQAEDQVAAELKPLGPRARERASEVRELRDEIMPLAAESGARPRGARQRVSRSSGPRGRRASRNPAGGRRRAAASCRPRTAARPGRRRPKGAATGRPFRGTFCVANGGSVGATSACFRAGASDGQFGEARLDAARQSSRESGPIGAPMRRSSPTRNTAAARWR